MVAKMFLYEREPTKMTINYFDENGKQYIAIKRHS